MCHVCVELHVDDVLRLDERLVRPRRRKLGQGKALRDRARKRGIGCDANVVGTHHLVHLAHAVGGRVLSRDEQAKDGQSTPPQLRNPRNLPSWWQGRSPPPPAHTLRKGVVETRARPRAAAVQLRMVSSKKRL